MRKLIIFFLICLAFSFNSNAQAPKPVNQDSIYKARQDSLIKLIDEKMIVTSAMIDSTIKRIGDKLSGNQFNQTMGYYQFFIIELKNYWLELNATEDKKKKK